MLIGREKEKNILLEALSAKSSQFVAVYGRRRVGKTYLVRETLKKHFVFEHTGLAEGSREDQLESWQSSLRAYGLRNASRAKTWIEAFDQLKLIIKASRRTRKVVFIDEIPWLETPRSRFMAALEHFWNGWASERTDVVLVVCGSASSWIVGRLINNYGGLHNRLTAKIYLQPFSLRECEQYLKSRHIAMNRYSIIECYMILGGIPYYWSFIKPGLSVAQNIDQLCFDPVGQLVGEYRALYASLFRNPAPYMVVVAALASRRIGLTREQIVAATQIANNGMLTQVLDNLIYCGFVRKYYQPDCRRKNAIYQLIDPFTIFHLQFMAKNSQQDIHYWTNKLESPERHAWNGLAFERVCIMHVEQIKRALNIAGVASSAYAWIAPPTEDGRRGAQVDLLIDRDDNVINLCECKFSRQPYLLTLGDEQNLANKIERVSQDVAKHKSIHTTLVAPYGVEKNAYSDVIQSVVSADDLFTV